MTSRAESITAAIATMLTTPTMSSVPSSRVFRDPDQAFNSDAFPLVLVETGDEVAPERVLIPVLDREIAVHVTVVAAGDPPNAAADAALVESFNRIVADRTLGGIALDILEGETTRQSVGMADHAIAVRKTYRVQYRTSQDSLEA